MIEVWKDVPGYEGIYQVSNMGSVQSLDRHLTFRNKTIKGKAIKPCTDKYGYKHILLHKDGKKKKTSIHRLVALAFIPNPNNYPIVNHIDENPSNNDVNNLEWCTVQYNNTYGHRMEKLRGDNNPISILTSKQVIEIKKTYKRQIKGCGGPTLAKRYNVSNSTIMSIIYGRSWKHLKEGDC